MYHNVGETGQARVGDVRHCLKTVGQSQAHQASHQTDEDLRGVGPGLCAEDIDDIEDARSAPQVAVYL